MNISVWAFRSVGLVLTAAGAVTFTQSASAQVMAYSDASAPRYTMNIFAPLLPPQPQPRTYAYEPAQPAAPQPLYESIDPEPNQSDAVLAPNLRKQTVSYSTREAPGTIVIDTPNKYLYYVLGNGQAIRYGVGVGREGFTWSGVRAIERKTEWPDWIPPAEMIARQPYLPRFMAGGESNPLGARAMYIGGTLYRIHGTNAPSTIGHNVSSGCIRMLNADVIDLYGRVNVGTKVVVLPATSRAIPVASLQRAQRPMLTSTRSSAVY
jgi:lipoprotein-anchoring transpeptidase ErfK/SrfK